MVNNSFGTFLNDYILNTVHPWGFERFELFDHVVDIISGKISLCFKGLRIGGGWDDWCGQGEGRRCWLELPLCWY